MSIFALYVRVLSLLHPVWRGALALVLANCVLATTQFVEPLLLGKVVDRLAAGQGGGAPARWSDVGPWVALWAALGLFSIIAGVLLNLFSDRLSHQRRFAAMADFFEHLMHLPTAFHVQAHTGQLLKIMIDGANGMFSLWLLFFREHCAVFLSLFVLLPATLLVNWRLGSLLFVLIALSAVSINFVVRRTQAKNGEANDVYSDIGKQVSDVLGNLPAVQSFTRIEAETDSLRAMTQRFLAAQFPVLKWWAFAGIATRAGATLTLAGIFVSGVALNMRGQATLGQIVAFMSLAAGMIARIEQSNNFVYFMFGQSAQVRAFFGILERKSDVVERVGATSAGRLSGDVRFEHVSFSYGGGPALNDISFQARPGETIALVGGTGSGKTTTLALLHRVFDPSAGRVSVDGRDIRDFTLNSLRANVGVVFQEPYLFARTIEENLRMGKSDASDAEIWRALERAQAADFVRAQAHGLATMVGERGRTLSGGERQRLAIARALLKDPPIMVLDEATSALDAGTETRLQQALDEAMRGRTTFVIAHRLATVRNADRILVLDRGRVIEEGTFETLVAKGGAFAALAKAQFMAEPQGTG